MHYVISWIMRGDGMSRPAAKKYKYKGKNITITEALALDDCTIRRDELYKRLKLRWDFELAVTTPRKQLNLKTKIYYEYNGKQYSIKELSDLTECVVTKHTLRQRVDAGWPLLEAMTKEARPLTKNISAATVNSSHNKRVKETGRIKIFASTRYRSN